MSCQINSNLPIVFAIMSQHAGSILPALSYLCVYRTTKLKFFYIKLIKGSKKDNFQMLIDILSKKVHSDCALKRLFEKISNKCEYIFEI